LTLKDKIDSMRRHPSVIKDILIGKKVEEIRAKIRKLDERQAERQAENEALEFISYLKQTSPYHINPHDKPKLNRLCYVEDWENSEIKEALFEIQKVSTPAFINRKNWELTLSIGRAGFIHRKDWEWALGIVAMQRFGKLNKKSTAIGVGCGTEPIPFYLANKLNHVYATDLYEGNEDWKKAAPADFPENPKKYAAFPYKEDALKVLRMNGTKLEFPSESFDIAFSFSSIEHFGGKNHSGALSSLREMERVLKPGGLAVISTEYILNDKEHYEFFNRRTIYSNLIDKLEMLQLVESLDLRITTNTLDTIMDVCDAVKWDTNKFDDEYKKTHPLILLRARNILFTSMMLVFQKQ
jgi:SAM-dependent methyltransferase